MRALARRSGGFLYYFPIAVLEQRMGLFTAHSVRCLPALSWRDTWLSRAVKITKPWSPMWKPWKSSTIVRHRSYSAHRGGGKEKTKGAGSFQDISITKDCVEHVPIFSLPLSNHDPCMYCTQQFSECVGKALLPLTFRSLNQLYKRIGSLQLYPWATINVHEKDKSVIWILSS